MASVFGITAAEMQGKIAPEAEEEFAFTIGDGADDTLSVARCLAIVEAAEAEVLGYLSLKYQEMVTRVEGEVLVREAVGGETELALGLWPATAGTVELYVNFPRDRAWSERRADDALDAGAFVLNEAGTVVTLGTALGAGDRVWGCYDHGAATRLLSLKKDAMGLAAAEIAREFAYFSTASGFERFEQWEIGARAHLRDVGRMTQSLVVLERVRLVNETRGQASRIAGILG